MCWPRGATRALSVSSWRCSLRATLLCNARRQLRSCRAVLPPLHFSHLRALHTHSTTQTSPCSNHKLQPALCMRHALPSPAHRDKGQRAAPNATAVLDLGRKMYNPYWIVTDALCRKTNQKGRGGRGREKGEPKAQLSCPSVTLICNVKPFKC